MRRTGCGDAPMSHAHARVADHGRLAVAPFLRGNPLDEVIAILRVLAAPQIHVALGVAHAARIDVRDCVALAAPIAGVGSLELGVLGNRFRRHAHKLPRVHALGGVLAKRREHANDRNFLRGVRRTINVGVNRGAVTQHACLIALAEHILQFGHISVRLVWGAIAHGRNHFPISRAALFGKLALNFVEFFARLARVALGERNLELFVAEFHRFHDSRRFFFSHRQTPSLCPTPHFYKCLSHFRSVFIS